MWSAGRGDSRVLETGTGKRRSWVRGSGAGDGEAWLETVRSEAVGSRGVYADSKVTGMQRPPGNGGSWWPLWETVSSDQIRHDG
jgi:hypothetical protein